MLFRSEIGHHAAAALGAAGERELPQHVVLHERQDLAEVLVLVVVRVDVDDQLGDWIDPKPHGIYVKPADGISYAVAALVGLLAANPWWSAQPDRLSLILWSGAIAYTIVILVAGPAVILRRLR